MKVILLDEVKGKGREGDVVDVARGFAVNYLFPRKMAVEATKGNVKQLEARKANIEKRETDRVSGASSLAAAMNGRAVTIVAKAGEGGRLFGSVTPQMIEDAVLEQFDIEIDRRRLDIHGMIKELGEHTVTVKVYHDITSDIVVKVVPEGAAVSDAEPASALEQVIVEDETADVAEAAEDEAAEDAEIDEEVSAEDANATDDDVEGAGETEADETE